MSVANDFGLIESDHEKVGHQSAALGSRRSRSLLSRDLHISGSESDGREEDDDARSHRSSRQDQREEQDSPPRSQAGASGVAQGGHAEDRPQGPPLPRDQVPRSPKDQTLYSRSGVNPIYAIINTRKHKVCSDVFNAFTGHPKKHDPAHVKLRETGWAMAQRVFHPPQG